MTPDGSEFFGLSALEAAWWLLPVILVTAVPAHYFAKRDSPWVCLFGSLFLTVVILFTILINVSTWWDSFATHYNAIPRELRQNWSDYWGLRLVAAMGMLFIIAIPLALVAIAGWWYTHLHPQK